MKYEIDCDALTTNEVAHQLLDSVLERDERIGEAYLWYGTLTVEILLSEPSDPRCDGNLKRTEKYTLNDIRRELYEGEVYCWAKNEDGIIVLLCRN